MSKKPTGKEPLHTSAEAQLAHASPVIEAPFCSTEQLLHEPRVHQIEQEAHNEELRRARIVLEESCDHYLDLYEFAPLGYFTLTRDGMISEMNLAAATLLGVERNKLLHHRFNTCVAPEYRDQWELFFAGLAQREERQSCELVLQRSDGSRFHGLMVCLLMAKDGDVPVVRITLTDITSLRQPEESMREWQQFVGRTILGMSFGDAESRTIRRANPAYARMHGYTVEELHDMEADSLYAPESRARIPHETEIALKTGYHSFECVRLRKDGSTFPARVDVSIVDGNGSKSHFIASVSDITERKQAEAALHKSETNLRAILDNLPHMTWVKDTHGRYLEVNKSYADYVRLKDPGQVIGKTDFDLWPKELAEKYRAEDAAVMATRLQRHIEEPSLDGDRMHWVETFKTPIIDGNGNVLGTTGFARDITERKQMEMVLRRSEENLIRAQAVGQIGSWLLDIPSNRLEWSAETYRMFGISRQQGIDLETFVAAIHPDDRNFVLKTWDEALAGAPYDIEHRIVAGGQERWVRERAQIERDSEGRALAGIGTVQDISERKRAEKELRASEQKFMRFITLAPIPLGVVNKDGDIVYLNERFTRVFGYTVNDVPTLKEWWQLAHPDESYRQRVMDSWSAAVDKAAEAGTDIEPAEYRVTCKSGAERFILIGGVAIEDNVLATFIDITERKLAEQALHQHKNLFRQIIDTDSNMISVKNAEGKFLVVNQALAAMHGMSPKELVGKIGAEQFQNKENFKPILQAGREAIETLRKVELVTHDHQNGMERWFHITKVPMKQEDGTVHVLGIGVDITEKRNAEQQLREHNAHIQAVREEEKAHIAREIHDDLGGTLTALKMEFYWLANEAVECKAATPMIERIEAMSQLLDSAANISRRIISELHPTILDALGLQAALEWQAGQFHKRTGIECRVICIQDDSCGTDLNKTQAINLFRIFQETLTNITKHSGASRVEAEFHCGREVILSIRDNGRGLPEGHTITSASYGMRGMTERVKHLDGEIKFDSPPVGGFEVTVRLPSGKKKGGEACAAS